MKKLPTIIRKEKLEQEIEDRHRMLDLERALNRIVKIAKRDGAVEFLSCDVTYEVVEVEDEWGWRTFEVKARIVTNERAPERVTTCDKEKE